MELIAIFKQIKCPVLKHGLKKIVMDYYFCKTCDKEQKFPICYSCLIKCHKGHQCNNLWLGRYSDSDIFLHSSSGTIPEINQR